MCYHYGIKADAGKLSKRYKGKNTVPVKTEVNHVSGFDHPLMPILNKSGIWELAEWGLVPPFVKSTEQWLEIRNKTLNARIETVEEKVSFREAFLHHPCLIPATHFFEWQQKASKKYPFKLEVEGLEIFSFAGIQSSYIHPTTGIIQESFSILTSEAEGFLAEIHNSKKRKPIVLNPVFEEEWLSGTLQHKDVSKFQLEESVWKAIPMPLKMSDWGNTPTHIQGSLF